MLRNYRVLLSLAGIGLYFAAYLAIGAEPVKLAVSHLFTARRAVR